MRLSRRGMLFALGAASLPMPAADAQNTAAPPGRAPMTASRRAEVIDIGVSAFPLKNDLLVPGTTEPFFQTDEGGRFHLAPRGGKLYWHPTYDDPRTLLVLPPAKAKPQALVVFFHGNLATLEHDVVGRQRVVAQFERSGLNAALVAPQLAVNALDSSPGRFYEQGFLDDYLAAAGLALAERSQGRFTADEVDALPMILVAYSGGYLAAAYSLPAQSHTKRRILGVVLLDALFGEEPKFADWLKEYMAKAFFVSAYSASSATLNGKLADELGRSGITVLRALPATLKPGDVVLQAALTAVHNDFVTAAWTRDPLAAVLRRIDLGPER